MKIVKLTDKPLPTDIPAQLRRLADKLESGEYPPHEFVMVIMTPVSGDDNQWPVLLGFGNDIGDLGRCGLVAQAQAWLTINKVARVG